MRCDDPSCVYCADPEAPITDIPAFLRCQFELFHCLRGKLLAVEVQLKRAAEVRK